MKDCNPEGLKKQVFFLVKIDIQQEITFHYQDKYPDTELSKKLGISRKSLWEKRKKYDIVKKK